MRLWSFSLGRIFGVEVRLHLFFLLLLALSVSWATTAGRAASRGLALWGLLLLAVLVREAARGLAAAWFGLEVKTLLLLPTGGLLTYGSAEAMARAAERRIQRTMALVGPLTSIVFGLALAGIILAVSPEVDLTARTWVSPLHLLRALVWLNLLLGAVNFLPAWPLDAGRVMRGEMLRASAKDEGKTRGWLSQAGPNVGPTLAVMLVVGGLLSVNWWVVMAGVTILLGAQVERGGVLGNTGADSVTVREVMLTEYSILSASATLEDAAEFSRHTLQDVFPVVRAGNMVGAVSRADVMGALEATGNGYLQGIMTRTFEIAAPGDSVVETLGRVTAATGVSSQLVPVVEGEQIVGILTPGNLQRAMGLVAMRMRVESRRAAEDENP